MSRANRKGFTFVEMLVGLAVFAIIALAINQTFKGAMELYGRENDLMAYSQKLRVFLADIRQDMLGMTDMGVNWTDLDQASFTSNSVSFYTLSHKFTGGERFSELSKVEYRLSGDTITRNKRSGVNICNIPTPVFSEKKYISRVRGLDFQYRFKTDDPQDSHTWSGEWNNPDQQDKHPMLIKMRVKLDEGQEQNPVEREFEEFYYIPTGVFGEPEETVVQ